MALMRNRIFHQKYNPNLDSNSQRKMMKNVMGIPAELVHIDDAQGMTVYDSRFMRKRPGPAAKACSTTKVDKWREHQLSTPLYKQITANVSVSGPQTGPSLQTSIEQKQAQQEILRHYQSKMFPNTSLTDFMPKHSITDEEIQNMKEFILNHKSKANRRKAVKNRGSVHQISSIAGSITVSQAISEESSQGSRA